MKIIKYFKKKHNIFKKIMVNFVTSFLFMFLFSLNDYKMVNVERYNIRFIYNLSSYSILFLFLIYSTVLLFSFLGNYESDKLDLLKEKRGYINYFYYSLIINILSSIIGLLFYKWSENTFMVYTNTYFVDIFHWYYLLSIVIPFIYTLLFTIILYFKNINKPLLKNILFLTIYILLIFSSLFIDKNRFVFIIFIILFFLAVIPLVYIIGKSILNIFKNNKSYLMQKFNKPTINLYFVLSFIVITVFSFALITNINKYSTNKKYFNYDYISTDENFDHANEYMLINKNNIVLFDDSFVLYSADLNKLNEYINISTIYNSSTANSLILSNKYISYIDIGDTIKININNQEEEFIITGFVETTYDYFCFTNYYNGNNTKYLIKSNQSLELKQNNFINNKYLFYNLLSLIIMVIIYIACIILTIISFNKTRDDLINDKKDNIIILKSMNLTCSNITNNINRSIIYQFVLTTFILFIIGLIFISRINSTIVLANINEYIVFNFNDYILFYIIYNMLFVVIISIDVNKRYDYLIKE